MFKKIREWYLKTYKFDKWWEEYCKDNYCYKCYLNSDNCKIDYNTGKCYSIMKD